MKRKNIAIGLTVCLLCAGIVFVPRFAADSVVSVGSTYPSALADRASVAVTEGARVVGVTLKDKYDRGSEFTLPYGQIEYKGTTVGATYKYLVFPDGKAVAKDFCTLDESGVYTLVYVAGEGDAAVTAALTFRVERQLLKVSNAKSSATLGKDALANGRSNVVVSIAAGDEFVYNNVIDLSDNGRTDKSLIRFSLEPSTVGTADATSVIVKLTDAYDPDNYVLVNFENHSYEGSWADPQTRITAAAAGQLLTGVENYPGENKIWSEANNEKRYGFPVYYSMVGKGAEEEELCIYFDASENQILSGCKNIWGAGEYGPADMICDLDSAEFFSEPWGGFTTGEVILSVYANNYQASACNLVITEIDGSSTFVLQEDKIAPQIEIDMQGYAEDELPSAVVGKEYALFGASAYDLLDGAREVRTSVYYRYDSEAPVLLSLSDGKFTPFRAGIYSAVYTASDLSGNEAVVTLAIEAKVSDGLSVSVTDPVTRGKTGVKAVLFDAEDVAYSGASGRTSYTLSVVCDATGEEIEVDSSENSFTPLRDGSYTVTVTAKDYSSIGTYTFTFTAERNTMPQIKSEAVLPAYFVKGAQYDLPALYGFDYSSGQAVETRATVCVLENGVEKQLTGKFIPSAAGTARVIYRIDVNGEIAEKCYDVPVVDVGFDSKYLYMERYFQTVTGTVNASAYSDYLSYTCTDDASVVWINALQTRNFTFNFKVDGTKNNVGAISLYLTDIAHPSKQLKFSYVNFNGFAFFKVNDEAGSGTRLTANFTGGTDFFNLTLNSVAKTAQASESARTEITTFLDGSEFTGFTNNTAYLTVAFEKVTGECAVNMYSLNRQNLNNAESDTTAPLLVVDALTGNRTPGEVLTFERATAADVLDPYVSLAFTIETSDGSYAKATDGTVMDGTEDAFRDYEVVFDRIGEYTVRYVATDTSGYTRNYVYVITVVDNTAPEVTLRDHKTTGKVGKSVAVAALNVKDNLTETPSQVCYVRGLNGAYTPVENGRFTPKAAGIYTVFYMVWDDAGNYTFVSYDVTVK